MADGDIKLKVDLDTSSSKKSAQNLGAVIQKALSSSSPKVQSLGLQLQKVADKSNKVAAEMRQLEKTKLPTAQFQALSKDIENTFNQLNKVEAEMERLKNKGGMLQPTADYGRLQGDEAWLSKKINRISEKKTLSAQDEQELAGLRSELQDVRDEMEALRDLGQAFEKSPAFKEKEAEAERLRLKLEQLNAESTRMQQAGEATVSGASTQRYADLVQNQANLATQANILKQKIVDTLADSSKLNTVFRSLMGTARQSFSLMGSAVSKLGQATKNLLFHHKTASFSFKKLLSLVIRYGFGIRSLFLLYRKLRATITEGTKAMGQQFPEIQAQLNSLNSSFGYFKSSLVSAFQPIFSYVVPALVTLINYLSSAMNAIANFFALLTGQGYYYKAVKGNDAVANSIEGAGSAADDANEKLAEYDKLLVIDQDKSGGGGGGAGGGGDYNWEKVETTHSKFFDEMKKAWEEGDWEGLGALISGKLTSMMNSIPWDTIYQKASNFGIGLAQFLNGLITPELFAALGTTIANAITTALLFLNNFGKEFKWKNFGESIAAGLNAFIENNPLQLAVETFNTWVNGILDTFITAIQKTNWTTLGQQIADSIGKIDVKGITWRLGTLVTSMVDAVYAIVSNKDTWKNIGQKIADGINGWSEGFDSSKVAKTVNAIANGIWTALGTAIKNIKWSKIVEDIIGFIGNLDIGTISLVAAFALAPTAITALKTTLPTLLSAEVAALGGVSVGTIAVSVIASVAIGWKIGNKLYEKFSGNEVEGGIADQLKEVMSGLFGEDKIDFDLGEFIEFTFGEDNPWNNFWGDAGEGAYQLVADLKQAGKDIVQGLKDGIVEGLTGIKEWITKKFTDILTAFKKLFGINSPSEVFKGYGTNIIEGLKLGLTNSMKDMANWLKVNVVDKILGAVAGIREVTTKIKGEIDSTFTSVQTAWNSIKKKTATLTAKAKDKTKGTLKKLKPYWDAIITKTSKLTAEAKDNASKILGTVKKAWDDIKSKTATLTTNKKGTSADVFSSIASAWGNIYSKAVTLTMSIKEGASTVKNWLSNAISKWFGAEGGVITSRIAHGFAGGGVVTEHAKQVWDNIPKYAGGTTNAHGTLFVAGEAGPEILGHINGRTEILNKSQLAVVMHAAVMNGMLNALKSLSSLNVHLEWEGLLNKLTEIPIPVIVKGFVLPANDEFNVKHEETHQDLTELKDLMHNLVDLYTSDAEGRNREPIVLQLDGKPLVKLIWDESQKRYKQTGRPVFG